ncbi:hypothetical protein GGI12_000548 [Dipsacomyces acuminosporus]|nr:hypothetical protein GGI12_000548 [Dipsacomyces acuminosporus]
MEFWGYPYEDHLVETRDGYILGIQRITGSRVNACPNEQKKKGVVLFWHGFMLNSECFICHPDWINILPFRLVEQGYDVWFGNSRGNKYSYKHMKYTPDDNRFWNFSIDEIANIDVPTTVRFILDYTNKKDLTYIGFSQGTTQMFMSLSRNRELNQMVSHFIALAPASTPRGFSNNIVDYFTKATPHMLYLLFGRKRAMSLVYFWINVLPRDVYVSLLDFCTDLLFGWQMNNLSNETKNICYWHLYSYTSVKAIVHWMQIIRCGELQMYDDDPPVYPIWSSNLTSSGNNSRRYCQRRPVSRFNNNSSNGNSSSSNAVSRPMNVILHNEHGYSMGPLTHWKNTYPLNRITTRISLLHGGSDSLSSVDTLLDNIEVGTDECICIDHYEHMDFLWADSVGSLVYPKVLELMGIKESFAHDDLDESAGNESSEYEKIPSKNSQNLLSIHPHGNNSSNGALTRRLSIASSPVSSICSSMQDSVQQAN